MKKVRDLGLLLFGVFLPFFLLVGFWVVAAYSKSSHDAPASDLIYMTIQYPHDGVKVEVIDNKIHFWIAENAIRKNLPLPHFYRFNAKLKQSEEIKIPSLSKLLTPAGKKDNETANVHQLKEIIIPAFKELIVDSHTISKDGYKVERSRSSSGLVNLIFINDYSNSLVIRKNLNTIPVVKEGEYNANTVKFLGWIISQ